MVNQIFNRQLLQQKRARAAQNFHNHNFLHTFVEQQFAERLDIIKRDFPNRLDITPHNDPFDKNEILSAPPEPQDLITSTLTLHTINDLPGALIQIKRALKPDGLFLGAMFGGETLRELRDSLTQTELTMKGGLSPRTAPLADKQDMGALMQRAAFALPVIDSEIVTVTYGSLTKLLHDLRFMGESNILTARNKTYPGKDFFKQTEAHYQQNHREPNGKLTATFEILFLLGWAPHESQQKPLKRGSAKNRLADALSPSSSSPKSPSSSPRRRGSGKAT